MKEHPLFKTWTSIRPVKYEHALAMIHYVYPNRKRLEESLIKDEDMETVDYIGDKDSSKEDRDALKNSES